MAIELTLRQQRVQKPSGFVVVNEITAIAGITDPSLIASAKRVFLGSRTANVEYMIRVCTLQDMVTTNPYSVPAAASANLDLVYADELIKVPAGQYKILFSPLPDYWDTVHNGSPTAKDTWNIETDGTGIAVINPADGAFPSIAPDGVRIPFQIVDAVGAPILNVDGDVSTGLAHLYRQSPDGLFRDSVMYQFFPTVLEGLNAAIATKAQLSALVADMNLTDDDFDLTEETTY